jgi:hypothetical protein
MPQRQTAANVALACFATFIASVLLMPVVASGYDPVDQTISEGVLERHGWLQVAGFLALAAGSFALAWCLAVGRPSRAVLLVAALLAFAAACLVIVAVLPTDADGEASTWRGRGHNVAATLGFLSNNAAMVWAGRAFRQDTRLRSLAGASLMLGLVALALLLVLGGGVEQRGLVQRGAVACIVLWQVLVALRLRTAPRDARSSDAPRQAIAGASDADRPR